MIRSPAVGRTVARTIRYAKGRKNSEARAIGGTIRRSTRAASRHASEREQDRDEEAVQPDDQLADVEDPLHPADVVDVRLALLVDDSQCIRGLQAEDPLAPRDFLAGDDEIGRAHV